MTSKRLEPRNENSIVSKIIRNKVKIFIFFLIIIVFATNNIKKNFLFEVPVSFEDYEDVYKKYYLAFQGVGISAKTSSKLKDPDKVEDMIKNWEVEELEDIKEEDVYTRFIVIEGLLKEYINTNHNLFVNKSYKKENLDHIRKLNRRIKDSLEQEDMTLYFKGISQKEL